jgi:hypothetical protein
MRINKHTFGRADESLQICCVCDACWFFTGLFVQFVAYWWEVTCCDGHSLVFWLERSALFQRNLTLIHIFPPPTIPDKHPY